MDKTFIVFKKVRVLSDGKCYPLFIDKSKPFEFGQWMHCEFHPTKGYALRSLNGLGEDAIGGWHACYVPLAPHLSDELKSGEKRVWIVCEAKGNASRYERPESQGGAWLLVEWLKPIKVLTDEEVERLKNGKEVSEGCYIRAYSNIEEVLK